MLPRLLLTLPATAIPYLGCLLLSLVLGSGTLGPHCLLPLLLSALLLSAHAAACPRHYLSHNCSLLPAASGSCFSQNFIHCSRPASLRFAALRCASLRFATTLRLGIQAIIFRSNLFRYQRYCGAYANCYQVGTLLSAMALDESIRLYIRRHARRHNRRYKLFLHSAFLLFPLFYLSRRLYVFL